MKLLPDDRDQHVGGQRAPDLQGIHSGTVNAYPVSMLLLACPRNPATHMPETTVFRVIQGQDALYVVQWAWRSNPPRT